MRNVFIAVFIAITLAACAGAPTPPPAVLPSACPLPIPAAGTGIRQDLTHVVAPGETLWRIGKMYDVAIQDIVRTNRLSNTHTLEKGQRLLVPCARSAEPVVTLYPSQKWRYIIIHHSATDVGNALAFDAGHLQRGFNAGLGYHFVICNGSNGKPDGFIEVSPRWIKQQDGAHCKADAMNNRSIGICLVGNFNHEQVSARQMDSLVYLIQRLAGHYRVSPDRIMGHGQVRNANTECPGQGFPWQQLRQRLSQAPAEKSFQTEPLVTPDDAQMPVPRPRSRARAASKKNLFRR